MTPAPMREARPLNRVFNAVNRRSPILIQTPWTLVFGECGEEIRFGVLKAQREGKRTLLVFHRHELFGRLRVPIANRELFLLESEYLYPSDSVFGRLAGWLLTAALALIRPWVLLWRSPRIRRGFGLPVPVHIPPTVTTIGTSRLYRPDGVSAFSWDVVRALQWREQYERYRPPRLADAKRRSAERVRLEMGIPPDAWFVALHVREDRFTENSLFKNGSIDRYFDATRAITAAGGWVVRLGDPTMTPLPPMERVVDYALGQWKSEVMDLYLISECRFFFGTTSGPYTVALLLDRPLLIVNGHECCLWGPMRRGDLGILKHVYSSRLGRVLSVKEVLEGPIDSQGVTSGFVRDGYHLIENSADEIREAVEEFMRPEPPPLTDLQRAFNAARSQAIRRWMDANECVDLEDELTEQYRMASWTDDAKGSLGQRYLEQNWDVIPASLANVRP